MVIAGILILAAGSAAAAPAEAEGETPSKAPSADAQPMPPRGGASGDRASGDRAPTMSTPEVEAGHADDGLEERVRRSRRQRTDALLEPSRSDAHYGDPGVARGEESFLGEQRPHVLRPRSPEGALALGALVGFGTGYFYAGSPRWGLIFTLADALLVGGFVVSTVELNSLVVEHDFNTGVALARSERDMTKLEQRWYAASIVFALAEVGSHAFQAFGGWRAARRTNESLASFSFVPLGGGGGMMLELEW